MSRIELPTVSSLSEGQKQQYDRFPANLTLALRRTTGSASGYLSLGGSFPRGAIGNKDREMIILRVGALSRSPYERMQYLPLARQAGWRGAEIAAIEAGHCSDERSQVILRFVNECVCDTKMSGRYRERVGSMHRWVMQRGSDAELASQLRARSDLTAMANTPGMPS
ncbi:hypothetical protein SB861_53545 [Paraburkholderia sp. SIMBA_049]